MKYFKYFALAALVAGSIIIASKQVKGKDQPSTNPRLTEVFSSKKQFTGIAVSKEGRTFINFPLWFKPYKYAVVEILPDGKMVAYPNKDWAKWKPGRDPSRHFVCVQALWVDTNNFLWILDPAAPGMALAVKGGPKLVKVDLKTNQVIQIIHFNEWTAPERSYLNDVRIDTQNNFAYITDSNLGAIVVVNLSTGQAKRVLANHPSTKAESGLILTAECKELRDKLGYIPQIHSDGIALDPDNQYLYYHALTANNLYRIDTRYLKDFSLSDEKIENHVELVGNTGPTDGMIMDNNNNIYLTSFTDNSIKCFNINTKQLETIVQNPQLVWPDSFSWGINGELYVTTSHVNRMPLYNQSKNEPKMPYKIFRINL